MKLPLSEESKTEIKAAYVKALLAAKESASTMKALQELLTEQMACLDEPLKKVIEKALDESASEMFRVKMQNYKLKNKGFEGREINGVGEGI